MSSLPGASFPLELQLPAPSFARAKNSAMSTAPRPTAERPKSLTDLRRYRVWDCYGSLPTGRGSDAAAPSMEKAFEFMLRDLDRFGIERISPLLQVGMGARGAFSDA